MVKVIYKSLLFVGLILFCACEGGTTFTKIIDNQSSENIKIKTFSIYGFEQVTEINSGESKNVYWDDQMGRFTDSTYHCTQEFDSIHVEISNNKILVKDIMLFDNWTKESSGGRNSKEECTFSISDDDVQ